MVRLLKVIVDRKRWYRGLLPDHSALIVDPGGAQYGVSKKYADHMCCLGFACIAAGLSEDDILGTRTPADVFDDEPNPIVPDGLSKLVLPYGTSGSVVRWTDSAICISLMDINDNRDISEKFRENRIKDLGKQVGLDFEFVN